LRDAAPTIWISRNIRRLNLVLVRSEVN
jgi:hypothetical protein